VTNDIYNFDWLYSVNKIWYFIIFMMTKFQKMILSCAIQVINLLQEKKEMREFEIKKW